MPVAVFLVINLQVSDLSRLTIGSSPLRYDSPLWRVCSLNNKYGVISLVMSVSGGDWSMFCAMFPDAGDAEDPLQEQQWQEQRYRTLQRWRHKKLLLEEQRVRRRLSGISSGDGGPLLVVQTHGDRESDEGVAAADVTDTWGS